MLTKSDRKSTRTRARATASPGAGENGPPLPDPILLEVFSNGLLSIAEEMGALLIRTAYSTNIKERHDASTAIFDAEGRITGLFRLRRLKYNVWKIVQLCPCSVMAGRVPWAFSPRT